MMALLQYFVLITVLFPFALGGDNLSCANLSQLDPWEICCNGDVYDIGEPFWPEESCNVEPKSGSLSFADSAWLAYDCNVRKSLNSTSLTLQSYINLMLPSRDSGAQSTLWETLTSHSNISEITADGEDERDRIRNIKLYHREFFHVAEQVCRFGPNKPTRMNTELNTASVDFKVRFSILQSSKPCNEEVLPHSAYFAGNCNTNFNNYDPYDHCEQEFYRLLGGSTYSNLSNNISTFCQADVARKLYETQGQVFKATLDFEGSVTSFFPGFWSKWVRNSVKNSIFEALKHDFNTQDPKKLESLMRDKIEERIKDGLCEDGKLTQMCAIVDAIKILQISDAFQKSAKNVCRFDAYRKKNL